MKNTKSRKRAKSSKKPDSYERFLKFLSRTCCVVRSAHLSGLSTSALYSRRSSDSEFSDRWDASLNEFRSRLLTLSAEGRVSETSNDFLENCNISYFVKYLDRPLLGDEIINFIKSKIVLLFQDSGMLSKVCSDTGISRQTIWRWMRDDPDFANDIDASYNVININLMDDLIHRAVHGTKENIIYHGEVVGERIVRSNSALIYAIKHLSSLGYGAQPRSVTVPAAVGNSKEMLRNFLALADEASKKKKSKNPDGCNECDIDNEHEHDIDDQDLAID